MTPLRDARRLIVVGMSLFPDPAELRALAARIDAHASAARTRADRLGAAVAATMWSGLAARAFAGQAHVAITALRSAADRLDTAASALRRHAEQVDDVLAAVHGIVRAGLATVEEIASLPVDLLRTLPGGVVGAGGSVLSTARGVVDDVLGFAGL
jgi:uncharacterized protein YukE